MFRGVTVCRKEGRKRGRKEVRKETERQVEGRRAKTGENWSGRENGGGNRQRV